MGRFKRRGPTGGQANGIPLKESTPLSVEPTIVPFLIVTLGAGALGSSVLVRTTAAKAERKKRGNIVAAAAFGGKSKPASHKKRKIRHYTRSSLYLRNDSYRSLSHYPTILIIWGRSATGAGELCIVGAHIDRDDHSDHQIVFLFRKCHTAESRTRS